MAITKKVAAILCVAFLTACGDDDGGSAQLPTTVDPGTGRWELVPADRVAEECRLDPDLLRLADEALDRPWAIVRYGKLCHEFYPGGPDEMTSVASATKTMAAVVTGIASYQTEGLPRSGRKTGPILDTDRADHWLDEFTFNPDALLGHILAMVAHNESLEYGERTHQYDAAGRIQINRLSDVINTALQQDPDRLGADLEEFTQRFLYGPLGMRDSVWSDGRPDKFFGFSWNTTIRDMARLGLLILNGGVWNGERILDEEWLYKLTHPAFEDSNTSYGYLTWLSSRSNWNYGGIVFPPGTKVQGQLDPCSPVAIHASYPHGLSEATDCGYAPPYDCEQDFDVGVWVANGAGGNIIVGHPGLDMVLIVKDLGDLAFHGTLWGPARPALVALDPEFQGDEEAFCEAYGANGYAPDLKQD